MQGCSLNRSHARSSGRLLLLLFQQQAAPGAARRGDRVGTPSTTPIAPTDACWRSGKPGLARRAQPRGPQSRVRGGERRRPPRPSWEAPGAGSRSPSLCPAPATTPARLLGTKAAGVARAQSGSSAPATAPGPGPAAGASARLPPSLPRHTAGPLEQRPGPRDSQEYVYSLKIVA